MKSLKVHYLNKYPGCAVRSSDSSFDVYSKDGGHLISMSKNGAGQWLDRSEEEGCLEKHDLAPLPIDCLYYKLDREGKIVRHDDAELNESVRSEVVKKYGKVPSIEVLAKEKNAKSDVRSLDHRSKYADLKS